MSVFTNIPGTAGQVKIKLEGEVWQPVQVTPRQASFPRLTSDMVKEGAERKLTIVNNMEGMADLTNIRSTDPAFSAEVKVLEPGKKFELTVSLHPPLTQGRHGGHIELSTGVPDKPTLKIPVYAMMTADVDITPKQLTLSSERTGAQTRKLWVRNYSRKPVKVTDLTVSNPAVKVSLEEVKEGMTYRVIVDVPADYKVPAEGDRITMKTDCPAVPDLTVPISERKPFRRTPGIRKTAGRPRPLPRAGMTSPVAPGATGNKPPPAPGVKAKPSKPKTGKDTSE